MTDQDGSHSMIIFRRKRSGRHATPKPPRAPRRRKRKQLDQYDTDTLALFRSINQSGPLTAARGLGAALVCVRTLAGTR